MKKELFFAIGAGLILGLIIAFGIWRVNKTITPPQDEQITTSKETPLPDVGFSVTIANLENLDVVTKSPVLISGLTKPESKVAISSEEKDYILESEKNGGFEKEVALIAGLNEIIIKSFDQKGDSAQTKLRIIYSSEFEKYIEVSSDKENAATDEAETVKQKVEEKVSLALKKPKAYLGTITDISESTYQIKNQEEEIEQVSFDKNTSFVKIDKTTKSITSADVAIGDSIIAMGFKNGNQVLEAKRILVTQIPEESPKNVYLGKISDLGKNTITLQKLNNQEELFIQVNIDTDYMLLKNEKATTIKFSEFKKEEIIYVFGSLVKEKFEARTVYKIELTETPSPEPKEKTDSKQD